MKKINLFAMLAAAVALTFGATSCNNDDDAVTTNGAGEKASISIGITSPDMSRATANNVGSIPADNTVTDFTAFVLDGGTLKSGYSNSGASLNITATTAATKIYVVANAGDLTSITSESDLLDYTADLNVNDGGAQSSVRWASGEVALASGDFTQGNDGWEATKSVELKFIAARIVLTIENGMDDKYDATKEDGSLVLKRVAVLNACGTSKLFNGTGTSLVTSPKKYYEGLANNNFANYPTGSSTVLESLLSDAIPGGDFTTVYYYYVFENDAATAAEFPTIITIVGEFDGEPVYYPVHLAAYEQFTGDATEFIKRGTSYNINIKLSVDPTIGGGNPGGPTDPTNPVVNANVSVEIEPATWTVKTMEKEFE